MLTGAALGDEHGAKGWVARIMAWDPFGKWVVGAAGLFFLGGAVYEIYLAARAKLDRQLDLGKLGPTSRRIVVDTSRFGIAARGVVSALVGVGLVVAAVHADPSRAQDVAEALDTVRRWSYGHLVLGLVAFGLASYGIYEIIEARFRRIRPV